MAKVDKIVEMLENRIKRGDYLLRPLPAETRLANEVGVSRMTARKAISSLVEKGLLIRGANGRVTMNLRSPAKAAKNRSARGQLESVQPLQLALLAPTHGSAEIERWRSAVEQVVLNSGDHLRIVRFHHWDDPVLAEAAHSFDGIFLVPPAEPIIPEVAELLRSEKAKTVTLDCDMTQWGIRSIDLVPPISVHRLLDHLDGLGHRTIDCFNVQPVDLVVEQRIEQWSLWREAQRADGELINEPDASYGNPPVHAYECMIQRLKSRPFKATAILCITMPAALGVMRALYESGIRVGKEVSVCTANDEGIAAMLCPSLTAIQMPDPKPYLGICLRWMAGDSVVSPLLSRPAEVSLFVGESTGPVSKA